MNCIRDAMFAKLEYHMARKKIGLFNVSLFEDVERNKYDKQLGMFLKNALS